jgi:small subunit ribosomal protein S1
VHISELAPHHVENPREVVSQGDAVNVRILEIDGERRRLSLSLKRVEEGEVPVPRADGAESVHTMPDLKLSEEAFPTTSAAVALEDEEVAETEAGEEAEAVEEAEEIAEEVVAEVELEEAEPSEDPAEEPALEVGSEQPDVD